ncbi:MAG: prepilin-type N-terminal cleavage/methylation domain-containing protein [Thermoanaerobaculaceae bacterium]|nr:prepilin-type N-terminal cleavage/methylation domain-containing protein [Thermoanaerobaculaceae bacterium]MDI9620862.1 prepilin-type N-terminal cleavage/methylation domain-containing protein [Acidobacteriota bacterium]NLH10133.1 hypothetical protein [Holophagae bacterium]HPW54730.1 prepilin-type N-terminal cleavage/methylation domain-containing protein [Thermoanaerobaculaceae bacterium]
MSRRSSARRYLGPRPAVAGFTLVELLAVLACLGMILWMAGQLLFPMRTAAERQRAQVEARQTARSAADYMAFVLRGATDGVPGGGAMFRSPLAIMTWVVTGNQGSTGSNPGCPGADDCVQTAFNNVARASDGNLADEGTDIITVGQFEESTLMRNANTSWPGNNSTTTAYWFYEQGCEAYIPPALPAGDDARNLALFDSVTGKGTHGGSPNFSKLMVAFDESRRYLFYQITDYLSGSNTTTCSGPADPPCQVSGKRMPCVAVEAYPDTAALNAPGGVRALTGIVHLTTGMRFMTFRVCNRWLQQRNGLFDPTADANCPAEGDGNTPGWTSLLPNVEDLQIAYIYDDGRVMNTAHLRLATEPVAGGCDTATGVPCQGFHGDPAAILDIAHVIGFRVTVVARSSAEVVWESPAQLRRVVEDTGVPAGSPDRFRRHVVSVNALLRNRVPMT